MAPSTLDLLERIRHDWARTQADLDSGPMLTVLLLERLHGALARQIERTYAGAGLNPAGWDLLLTLYRSAPPGGLTPTELSELAAITGPSMTNRVDRLAGKGLVERQPCESDRRSVRIQLTPGGRALVERLLPQHLDNAARVLAALDPAQTQALRGLAATLIQGLEALEGEPAKTPVESVSTQSR